MMYLQYKITWYSDGTEAALKLKIPLPPLALACRQLFQEAEQFRCKRCQCCRRRRSAEWQL